MLADVLDVAKRAGAYLDDPSNSIYTMAYLMPFINQCYDVLDVALERAGMQYIESIAVFPLPNGVTDLSPYMQDGQPLATMKFPKLVKWKLQGDPDYLYRKSAQVEELDEVDTASSIGALEWRFGGGALQVTPSSVATTLKVYFDQMSTVILDPNQGVIRGTAHILAFDVARAVAQRRKGMEQMAKDLKEDHEKAWNAFKSLLVMNSQGQSIVPPATHPRSRRPAPAGYC